MVDVLTCPTQTPTLVCTQMLRHSCRIIMVIVRGPCAHFRSQQTSDGRLPEPELPLYVHHLVPTQLPQDCYLSKQRSPTRRGTNMLTQPSHPCPAQPPHLCQRSSCTLCLAMRDRDYERRTRVESHAATRRIRARFQVSPGLGSRPRHH